MEKGGDCNVEEASCNARMVFTKAGALVFSQSEVTTMKVDEVVQPTVMVSRPVVLPPRNDPQGPTELPVPVLHFLTFSDRHKAQQFEKGETENKSTAIIKKWRIIPSVVTSAVKKGEKFNRRAARRRRESLQTPGISRG
eukprot:sb/3474349/